MCLFLLEIISFCKYVIHLKLKAKNTTKSSLQASSLYSIKKLQLRLNYVNWIKIFEMILDNGITVNSGTEIYMHHMSYFMELRKILKRTPKR